MLCRVLGHLCALPLAQVEETMRPLAVKPVRGVPAFVAGLAVIRGAAMVVIDAALLLAGTPSKARRFITLRAGPRRIALAVDLVIGVRTIGQETLRALPPLFHDADAIAAVGTLDSDLVLVLQSARIVSEEAWQAIDASARA